MLNNKMSMAEKLNVAKAYAKRKNCSLATGKVICNKYSVGIYQLWFLGVSAEEIASRIEEWELAG